MSIAALLRKNDAVGKLLDSIMAKPIKFTTSMKVDELTLTVGKQFGTGDICDLWNVSYETPSGPHAGGGSRFDRILEDEDGSATRGILKHATDYLDDDLVENECKILSELYPTKAKDEKFYRYLPRPLAMFRTTLGSHEQQAILLPFLENYVSLSEVIAAYPKGLPSWEDSVWMLNRLMEGLGFVHQNNVVHGALVPDHVMVHPRGHGAKIIDWSYACESHDRSESRVRAMVRAGMNYYPPEIRNSERVSSATDMFFVGKLGIALLGGNVDTNAMPDSVPEKVQKFLLKCAEMTRSYRMQRAWDARDEFEEIVVSIVGKRKYRPFEMPPK